LQCAPIELHLKSNFQLQFDILELDLWIVIQLEICGFHFQILRFGIALFKSNCISDFHHCYIQHLHCWKSDPNSTEDHRFSKIFACGRQIGNYYLAQN